MIIVPLAPTRILLAWTALAMALVATAAPLRSAGLSDPTLLRPHRFVAIPIRTTASDLASDPTAATLLNGDLVEGLTKETPARFLPLESVEEASGEMLRRVRVPAQVPERLGKPSVTLITASQSSYLVDLPKLHTALADAGVADLQLPPNLHGKKLLLNVGAGVRLQWGSGPGALRLVQTRQPTVVVPAEIDVDGLRDLILGHPDLADGSAAVSRLREVADWRATFPLPIPDGWTSEEVAVDQTEGLLVRPGSVGLSALFWQRAGIVYVLSGALPPDHLIAVADSL